MESFFSDYEKNSLEKQAESEQSFNRAILLQLCKAFDLDCSGMKNDPEFNFQWFHSQYPRFPIRLDSRKLKVDLHNMFSAMTRTEVWDSYMNILEETTEPRLALFVRVPGQGTFVIHNAWGMSQAPGFTRLVRVAKTTDKGIIFESLASFVASLQQSGWTP